MRILFAGTPEPAVPSLHALLESEHEVVAVLTRPDARKGRGRTLHRSDVGAAADAAGIPVLTPRTLRDPEAQQEILAFGAEAAAVVAYGNLVPQPLLDAMPWVNLHFSLLPRWRGAAPVQRAIAAGDAETGAMTFLLEAGLDTGPVLGEIRRPILPTDTAGTLLEALAVDGAPLLVDAMTQLATGTAAPRPQPTEGITLAPKVEVAEARVDWTEPADVVDRRIRAVTPAPGAWSVLTDGSRIKIGPVAAAEEDLAPGRIDFRKNAVLVGCGDGAVQLGQVAPAGKAMMDAAAWGRGVREHVDFEEIA